MKEPSAIVVRDLRKTYGATEVLRGISSTSALRRPRAGSVSPRCQGASDGASTSAAA